MFFYSVLIIIVYSCINPFAPKLDETIGSGNLVISDQASIDGLFNNFQLAYTFKDTLIYGELLSDKFIFTFRNYEKNADESWGREEEMRVHYGLFQNSERLDLIWNDIVSISEDSTDILRSFDLTITFSSTDIVLINGKINLILEKVDNKWQIVHWIDQSNF